MMKQKLMASVIGLCLGLSAVSANATGWPVFDVLRTAKFAGQGIERLLGYISEFQKKTADESELEVLEKKRDIEHLPQKNMYAYWEQAKPTEMESNSLMPGQSKIDDAKSWIRDNYFLPEDKVATSGDKKSCDSSITEQQRRDMKEKRRKYVEAMAKETLSLADGTRKSISSELAALKEAETTGAAQIQQVDLMVQTKKTMIEQKIADLYLQTRLMEMEAMGMMTGLPMQLIPDPAKVKELCVDNQVWVVGGGR